MIEQSVDVVIKVMFHNGWNHDDYVGNVFMIAGKEYFLI